MSWFSDLFRRVAVPVPAPVPAPKPAPAVIPAVAADNFPACVKLVLVHEGGNDDDPRDPGGRTSRGIIQREYDTWRHDHPNLPADVWKAPQQTILDIYQAKYWIVMRCADLPRGIDYCVFDYGVNSGISRGIKQLQTLLGVAVDGVIGPATLAAAKAVEPVAFIGKYQDARLAFLRGLSTWGTFGGGWGRRVSEVRKDALAMAKVAPAVISGSPSATPTMLILRGIAGTFAGKDYPRGALDEPSALAYATKHGYVGRVLDVAGATGPDSAQVHMALDAIHRDQSITALYGFSGGGYNLAHIIDALTPAEKTRINLMVVLGAPNNPESRYNGPWELVYRTDPPGGHMDGPRALLAEAAPKPAVQPNDLGHRIKRTMLAASYPWFDDQNVVSVEGMDPDGKPNNNRTNAFDDIKMVLDGDGKIIGGPWYATTMSGAYWTKHRMNPDGAFDIDLGPQSIWTPGDYHDLIVWRQAEDSHIRGFRDDAEDFTRSGTPQLYGDIGVHHHGGGDQAHDDIGRRAAGCQVIEHTADQAQFMRITLACPRYLQDKKGFRLTATVLQAKDILP